MPFAGISTGAARIDFSQLPKYAGYRDLLDLYAGDWDALLDAWVSGAIPWAVRQQARETLDPTLLQALLLERLIRQQQEMTTLLADLLLEIRTAPTVERL